MRIGELAALVGVSTRTVRHCHHLGLPAESERLGNTPSTGPARREAGRAAGQPDDGQRHRTDPLVRRPA